MENRWFMVMAAVGWLAMGGAARAQTGNADAGEDVFKKCRACHDVGPDAKKKVGEAADATADAAKAKRDEYVAAMSKRLDEMNAKYEDLKTRAASATGDAKKDLEKKRDQAKAKLDAAAKKIEEMKTASLDRWEKIKDATGNAFDDLKKAIE